MCTSTYLGTSPLLTRKFGNINTTVSTYLYIQTYVCLQTCDCRELLFTMIRFPINQLYFNTYHSFEYETMLSVKQQNDSLDNWAALSWVQLKSARLSWQTSTDHHICAVQAECDTCASVHCNIRYCVTYVRT